MTPPRLASQRIDSLHSASELRTHGDKLWNMYETMDALISIGWLTTRRSALSAFSNSAASLALMTRTGSRMSDHVSTSSCGVSLFSSDRTLRKRRQQIRDARHLWRLTTNAEVMYEQRLLAPARSPLPRGMGVKPSIKSRKFRMTARPSHGADRGAAICVWFGSSARVSEPT